VKQSLVLGIILVIVLVGNFDFLAYGHSRTCMTSGNHLRIEDENFTTRNISVGQSMEIQGRIVSLNPNEQNSKMWVVLDNYDESYFLDDITRLFSNAGGCASRTFDGNSNWFFNIDSDPANVFILEPNTAVPFKIDLLALKSGNYHIHSAVLIDDVYYFGPGGTVTVEGNNGITDGEIFGFYLPFIASIIGIIFVTIIGVVLIRRKMHSNIGSGRELS